MTLIFSGSKSHLTNNLIFAIVDNMLKQPGAKMQYPEHFTAEDIMEFEYEYNRYIDLQDPYSLIAVNAELQSVAEEQQRIFAENLDIFA
jgi:hypothetical protein